MTWLLSHPHAVRGAQEQHSAYGRSHSCAPCFSSHNPKLAWPEFLTSFWKFGWRAKGLGFFSIRTQESQEVLLAVTVQILNYKFGGRNQRDSSIQSTEEKGVWGVGNEVSVVGFLSCYWIPMPFSWLPWGYRRQIFLVGGPWLGWHLLLTGADKTGQGERGWELAPGYLFPWKHLLGSRGEAGTPKESRFQFEILRERTEVHFQQEHPLRFLFPPRSPHTHWKSLGWRDKGTETLALR